MRESGTLSFIGSSILKLSLCSFYIYMACFIEQDQQK